MVEMSIETDGKAVRKAVALEEPAFYTIAGNPDKEPMCRIGITCAGTADSVTQSCIFPRI